MKQYRQNVFTQYILGYLLILLVPLSFAAFILSVNLHEEQQNALRFSTESLNQNVSIVETRLTEIENMSILLTNNEVTQRLLRQSETNFYSYYALYNLLNDFRFTNSFIHNAYVAFEDSDMVVGSDGIVSSLDHFYRIKYNLGDQTYQKWQDMLWRQKHYGSIMGDSIQIDGKRENVLVYQQSLVISNRGGQSRAILIIFVREKDFLSLLANHPNGLIALEVEALNNQQVFSFQDGEVNWVEIGLNDGQNVMLHNPKEVFVVEAAPASGRIYTGLFEKNYLLRNWYNQLMLTSLTFLSILSLGLMLSVHLAKKNSIPIKNVLELLSRGNPTCEWETHGVFNYLQGSVHSLLNDNQRLTDELEKRVPLLRAAFIGRLLGGSLNDYSDIYEQLSNLGIHLQGKSYCVMAFQIAKYPVSPLPEGRQSLSTAKLVVEKTIYFYLKENLYIHATDDNLVVVILPVDESRPETVRKDFCKMIVCRMAEEHRMEIRVGIGLCYESISDVSLSFLQAERSLDTVAEAQQEQVVQYRHESSTGHCFYYYPVELEQRLIRMTRNGDQQAVNDIFSQLHAENIGGNRLSPSMYQSFMVELHGSYLKVLSGLRGRESIPLAYLDEAGSLAANADPATGQFDMYRLLMLEVCRLVRHSQSNKTEDVRQRLLRFVEENFRDPGLNLARLASEFQVTEVYMSRLFKESLNETFSQYLERVRMDYANTLLPNTALTISQIAEASGYGSPHTFRRSYKRIYGNSPKQERK